MKAVLIGVGVFATISISYLLFFGSADPSEIKNYPSAGTEIVAFGDSLVEGVGATEGNDFVSILSDQLGTPIVNLGKRGDTTADGVARIDEVLNHDSKIVIILLGGNDYIRKVPEEETFANLRIIIESIQETGAIVVLLGVQGGILTDGYKDDFKKLSEQYKTAYVPNVLDGLIGLPDLMNDPIHPNDKGYKIIADKVLPVVEGLVE